MYHALFSTEACDQERKLRLKLQTCSLKTRITWNLCPSWLFSRAFDHIFETIQVSEGTKYLVHASYLEIYNEEVRDLLGKDNKKRLELKEHPDKGVYVQGMKLNKC